MEYSVNSLSGGSVVKVVFPGQKASVTSKGKVIYDYRVDIKKQGVRTTLSHANIVVDIYNKCQREKGLIRDLRTLLGNIILEGDVDPYRDTRLCRGYELVEPPGAVLLERVGRVHEQLGKAFNSVGNQSDLSIEELIAVVKWIALQEDINYPMPRFEGRRMPFARYLEAIYCAEGNAEVDNVIRRALTHSRPGRWDGVDYGIIDQVLSSRA
jgi:hypothetical protein